MSVSDKTLACIHELRHRDFAESPLHGWAENQQARLSLWADTLGVFAPGHLSLARRLRLNADVNDILIQLLNGLHGSLVLLRASNLYSGLIRNIVLIHQLY